MKKLFVTFLLMFAITVVVSQTLFTFKAFSFSSRYHTGYKWTDWCSALDSEISIYVNTSTDKITFDSDYEQVYKIVNTSSFYDEDGDLNIKYDCVDKNLSRCTVRFINREQGVVQCYVYYQDIQWMYNTLRVGRY